MMTSLNEGAIGRAALIVGTIQVQTVKDNHFSLLRHKFGVPDNFLDGQFDFGKLTSGGGKGGDLMARSFDDRYFVKQLNKGDGRSLLDEAFLREYIEVVSKGTSLLCRIFAVFRHPTQGIFLAMNNCMPTHIKTWAGMYDLKGTADDKTLIEDGEKIPEIHKRCWQFHWMVCEGTGCNKGIPFERTRYIKGKRTAYESALHVTKEQKAEVVASIKLDTALLQKHMLMDYSMLVGVYRPPPGTAALEAVSEPNGVHAKAYMAQHAGDTTIIYLGIIDFLQGWTGGKQCAHVIKTLFAPPPVSTVSPPIYAKRFVKFFEFKIKGCAYSVPSKSDYVDDSGQGRTMEKVEPMTNLVVKMGTLTERLKSLEARIDEIELKKGIQPCHTEVVDVEPRYGAKSNTNVQV